MARRQSMHFTVKCEITSKHKNSFWIWWPRPGGGGRVTKFNLYRPQSDPSDLHAACAGAEIMQKQRQIPAVFLMKLANPTTRRTHCADFHVKFLRYLSKTSQKWVKSNWALNWFNTRPQYLVDGGSLIEIGWAS